MANSTPIARTPVITEVADQVSARETAMAGAGGHPMSASHILAIAMAAIAFLCFAVAGFEEDNFATWVDGAGISLILYGLVRGSAWLISAPDLAGDAPSGFDSVPTRNGNNRSRSTRSSTARSGTTRIRTTRSGITAGSPSRSGITGSSTTRSSTTGTGTSFKFRRTHQTTTRDGGSTNEVMAFAATVRR